MNADEILMLLENINDPNGLYLLVPINKTSGFFTCNRQLIYIASDEQHYPSESVETDYLHLQTHVEISGVKNQQTFANGFYNLIIYKEISNHENLSAFINLCETHARNKEEQNFKDFFYSLITLFQLPTEQSYKNVVGLYGELKILQLSKENFNIDLSRAWHRNGTYSRYDFSSEKICLEVKTISAEEDAVTIKHKQIFDTSSCYLAVITCKLCDSGQTINELITEMLSETLFFSSLNFSMNLAKELKRISPRDAQNLRLQAANIRFFSASDINPFNEIPENVSSLTYKLDLTNYNSLPDSSISALISQLK